MSHHSGDIDPKLVAQYEELFGKVNENRPGPTGQFPNGSLLPTDEGELRIAVTHKDGAVIVDFGKPTAWVGFRASEIRGFIDLLEKHAEAIGAPRPK